MTKLQMRVASAALLILATGIFLSRWPDPVNVALAAITGIPALIWIALAANSIRDRRKG